MLRHLRTRTPLLLAVLILFLGLYAGTRWGLYVTFPALDKILHVAGGLVAAWFALALLQDDIVHMRAWKQTLIIVSVAVFVGVLWEVAEYAATFTKESLPLLYRYFRGGDLGDTIADLLCDTAGAGLLTVWALWKERT